jgi:hypothetical protein
MSFSQKPEILDIRDKDGNATGRTITRESKLNPGDYLSTEFRGIRTALILTEIANASRTDGGAVTAALL